MEFAEDEGIATDSFESADVDVKLVRASLVLDDLRHFDSNLGSYGIGIVPSNIKRNGEDYPNLIDFLETGWDSKLEFGGAYQLPVCFPTIYQGTSILKNFAKLMRIPKIREKKD